MNLLETLREYIWNTFGANNERSKKVKSEFSIAESLVELKI